VNTNVLDLYKRYKEGAMSRRAFLDRLTLLVGGTAAALALLPVLENQAEAQTIPEDDARLTTSIIEYDAGGIKMKGYFAAPIGNQKRPAVLVIHENRGLNAHIKDVTRRIAVEGFLALAPDILSPFGGTPEDEAQIGELFKKLVPTETVPRLAAGVTYLARPSQSTGKVGVVGFCWGGGMANLLAISDAPLLAIVPYYGPQPPAEEVPKIKAALLLHYGATDQRINAGIQNYVNALKAGGKNFEYYIYEGAGHAFNNDTNPDRYNKEAATQAWTRTIAFFKKYLA
jgi:carboxymethylenebutenolidase